MTISRWARTMLKEAVYGPPSFPQQCIVGLSDPQTEVDVLLGGLGAPIDVTQFHMMACGAPLLIGIGLGPEHDAEHARSLTLEFREHGAEQYLLGEIGLCWHSRLPLGSGHACLFRVTHFKNHCLAQRYLWPRYFEYYRLRRRNKETDVPITTREIHAMIVYYTCPRPIVLVSATDGTHQNMFPMNLMGRLGDGYFGFALNANRAAAPLIERAGSLVLSSVPFEQAKVVAGMGGNHRRETIDWNQLPFPTTRLGGLQVPIPCFASSVRELKVQETRIVGSHRLFLARVVRQEQFSDAPQFFVVHGVYQARRALTTPTSIAKPTSLTV